MSHVTRILVTGGEGILAQALRPYFPLATFAGKGDCDVTNANQVRAVFNEVKPELVIHCAAITRHDADPAAYTVGNIQGTINVALQAKKSGCRLVYPSTDYLMAARETDPTRPVNSYADSKYAGELAIRTALPGQSLLVRGSWYSVLEYTHAAVDAFTSKLPVAKAAHYVAVLATSTHTGVVNIGGQRRSLYEIALEFNESVLPCTRAQLGLPYDLPADCSLDTTKLTRLMKVMT